MIIIQYYCTEWVSWVYYNKILFYRLCYSSNQKQCNPTIKRATCYGGGKFCRSPSPLKQQDEEEMCARPPSNNPFDLPPSKSTRSTNVTEFYQLPDVRRSRKDQKMSTSSTATTSTSSSSSSSSVTSSTTMASSDMYAPSTFHGHVTESADSWLVYFNKYCDFKSMNADAKLKFVQILLRDGASDWFDTLPAEQKATFAVFSDSFKARFAPTDLTRFHEANQILSLVQAENQSVDDYIMAMTRIAKRIPMADGPILRYAIIKGMKPHIRTYVLQQNVHTMNELINTARVAEMSTPSNDVSMGILLDEIRTNRILSEKNSEQVAKLSAQMRGLSTVAAVGSDRRSPSPRRVTFAATATREPTPTRNQNGRGRPYRRYYQHPTTQAQQQHCGNCGKIHLNDKCFAATKNCYRCGRLGHIGVMCRSGRRTYQQQSE